MPAHHMHLGPEHRPFLKANKNMPAYLTHYTCGLIGYHRLKQGRLKTIIRRNAKAYNMGLAGPDLFFYSLWEIAVRKEPIGRIIHKQRTGRFLRALFEEVENCRTASARADSDAYETALAYFCGFLGHYCLDSRSHELVYRVCAHPDSKVALGRHFRYEAAMDAMCCEQLLGRRIARSHQMGLLRLNHAQQRVIAEILHEALKITYGPEIPVPSRARLQLILREYYLISGLITDPTGFKEWAFEKLERKVIGYPFASPLFINDNRYGLGQDDWIRFRIRFRRGVRSFDRLLNVLEQIVCEDNQADEAEKLEVFRKKTGSWSYHGMWPAE